MNPRFSQLKPYPFERFREILSGTEPQTSLPYIDLSIGEPKHPTPLVIRQAITDNLDGLGAYPPTAGSPSLRDVLAKWLTGRFAPATIDPKTEVLPVLGSREALFALAQVVIDPTTPSVVVSPNPFYQIYEGAALLAGASMHYVAQTPEAQMTCAWSDVPASVWSQTSLLFVCTPGNPTGSVVNLDEWRLLFELSDKYNFVIASDECYSELYPPDTTAPIGALQASALLGRSKERLIVFGSLSKRSNAPGLRSGYAAGSASLVAAFLKYRTYHGSAMSPTIQQASIAAWQDESHVAANRAIYEAKYQAVIPILSPWLPVSRPAAGFYLWVEVPGGDDVQFSIELYRQYNVRILPGSLLGRVEAGGNPGAGKIRLALVAPLDQCVEAAKRIAAFCELSAGEGLQDGSKDGGTKDAK